MYVVLLALLIFFFSLKLCVPAVTLRLPITGIAGNEMRRLFYALEVQVKAWRATVLIFLMMNLIIVRVLCEIVIKNYFVVRQYQNQNIQHSV